MPFNSSLCLSARAKTSSITLPRNAERGHYYLEPDLRREAFSHCAMLILGSCSCAKSNWRSSPWFLVCRDFLSPGSKWQRSRSSLVGPFGVSDKAAIKLCTGLQALKLELKLKTPLLSSPPRLFAGGCRLSLWGPLCGPAHNMAFPRATDPGEREKERNVTLTFTIPPEITPSHLPYLVCI